MLRDLCPVGKNQFQTLFFSSPKTKNTKKNRKWQIFTLTYILALYFLKCHTFFPTVIFYFFQAFLVLDEENKMCLKLIFTYWAQVSEHSTAILVVHIKHRDRYLFLGEIRWNTLYICPGTGAVELADGARYIMGKDTSLSISQVCKSATSGRTKQVIYY